MPERAVGRAILSASLDREERREALLGVQVLDRIEQGAARAVGEVDLRGGGEKERDTARRVSETARRARARAPRARPLSPI